MMHTVMNVICSFMGTIGFAVMFNVPMRFYLCCGFTGTAGWMAYYAIVNGDMSAVTASFFGTLAVVLISRILTVLMKCPITIFLVPGIIPLVPGAGIYYRSACGGVKKRDGVSKGGVCHRTWDRGCRSDTQGSVPQTVLFQKSQK